MKRKEKRPLNRKQLDWLTEDNERIPSDVLGSYTGRPADPNDKPTQDADDL